MILYQTHRDSIELLERDAILVVKAIDYGMENEVRKLMECLLDNVKSHEITDVIFDLKEWDSGLPPELNDWFLTDYLPRLLLAGLENAAVISPSDPFSLFNTEYIVQEVSKAFNIKYFKDFESGKIWLLNTRYFNQFRFSEN